jgi:hypothetical protein
MFSWYIRAHLTARYKITIRLRTWEVVYLFAALPTLALRPTQPAVQWVKRSLAELKWTDRENKDSTLSSTNVYKMSEVLAHSTLS